MELLSIPMPDPNKPFDFAAYQEVLRAQERERAASVLASLGTLPPRPHLGFYKRLAQTRHKERQQQVLRVQLSQVQDELARELGFPNWPRFSQAISERRTRAERVAVALAERNDAAVAAALEVDAAAVVDVALSATYEDLWYLTGVARFRSAAASSTMCTVGFAIAQHASPEELAGQLEALQLQYFQFDWMTASTVISDRMSVAAKDQSREHDVAGFEEALSHLANFEEVDTDNGPFDMD
jgi:hypothetical protein